MASRQQTAPPATETFEASDALALLTEDHEHVRQLFEAYEDLVESEAGDEDKEELADQICMMLTVHSTIEEEIFYPAARQALDAQDLLDEATVEHASARDLIAQIEDMRAGDELFDAKVRVLGEYVAHHVAEEEDELFPQLAEAEGLDLQALGAELLARKQALLAESGVEEEA